MEFKDYYSILGVRDDADADEIKRAYRRLARKFHPDVSDADDAESRFKEIGEAYEVLKDPEKREYYDLVRANGGVPPEMSNAQSGDWQFKTGGFTDADASAFSDFFRDIFGGGERGGQTHWYDSAPGEPFHSRYQGKGQNYATQLALTLEEAFEGGKHLVAFSLPRSFIPSDGRADTQKKIRVTVPAGVVDGQELRLRGQGAPGLGGGPAGDLYVTIKIAPHPHFVLDGKDIRLSVPVAPWEVALGAEVEVPTLAGRVKVIVPSGQPTVRLKGRGMPGNPPGDQYLHFDIVLPDGASDPEQQSHWQALAKQNPSSVRDTWPA